MVAIIIFFLAHWYGHLFFQSFLHHRYAAHGMFTMRKGWENFFKITAFIVQGSSYLSPYAHGVMHILHHQNVATNNDPHPAELHRGFLGMIRMTITMIKNYRGILMGTIPVPENIVRRVPRMTRFDMVTNSLNIRIIFVAAYVVVYALFAPHWAWFLLLPIHIFMGPIHGVMVNWFTHKFGYTNDEDKSCNARNIELKIGRVIIPIFGIIMLGEFYHANHHKRPKVNFAKRLGEFDPIYPITKLFDWLNIIKIEPAYR